MRINKSWEQKAVLCLTLFSVSPMSVVLAQAKTAPVTSAPIVPLQEGTLPQMATTSAHLLLSSPAAMAQVKQQRLAESQAYALVKTGNVFATSNDWQNAQSQYQQALDVSPPSGLGHQLALYGLIDCCRATGDTKKGMEYSRQAIYRNGSAAEGFYENDTAKLMQFALLLNRTGQEVESVQVYNHAAAGLDYQDSQFNGGEPHLKVLLPEIVGGTPLPGQVQYTPGHLQALADTALAYKQGGFWSDKEVLAHVQEAVTLYPDSPVTHYYLGEVLLRTHDPGAKAAYQKAAALGDNKVNDAVKECLQMVR